MAMAPRSRLSLLKLFMSVCDVGELIAQELITVQSELATDVDPYEEVLAGHFRREDEILVDLFDQIGDLILRHVTIQDKRPEHLGRAEVQVKVTESLISVHDLILLGRACAGLSMIYRVDQEFVLRRFKLTQF